MTIMAMIDETNDSDDSNSVGGDNGDPTANAGWADAVAKILKSNKPKSKKTLVLSRAKKLTDIKREKRKPAGFEVATADGEIKEETIEVTEQVVQPPQKKTKRELPKLRVKPNILDKDRERTLTKIATRGVVQLFNAVRTQQKDISKKLEEAGPLEARKEKVLKSIDKRAFLDVLMGEKSSVDDKATESVKKQEGNSTWSVLREDFMMGAKMKDWDKEIEPEMETEQVEIEAE